MSQTCTQKGCNGRLVSLYYKVGTRWLKVKDRMICSTCETLYTHTDTLTPIKH